MTLEDGPNKYSGIEPEDVRGVLTEFPEGVSPIAMRFGDLDEFEATL